MHHRHKHGMTAGCIDTNCWGTVIIEQSIEFYVNWTQLNGQNPGQQGADGVNTVHWLSPIWHRNLKHLKHAHLGKHGVTCMRMSQDPIRRAFTEISYMRCNFHVRKQTQLKLTV